MPSGSLATEAQGIGDNGNVVGAFVDFGGIPHGFLWDGTKYTQNRRINF
jgi:probable HAF family extracellular repeat protein